jgi:hypothetical protein
MFVSLSVVWLSVRLSIQLENLYTDSDDISYVHLSHAIGGHSKFVVLISYNR